MMTWIDVLRFESNVRRVAKTFAVRANETSAFEDDLVQSLFLDLFETVDLSRATKQSEQNYVNGCLFNAASTMCFGGRAGTDRARGQSLDDLVRRSSASGEKSASGDVKAVRKLYEVRDY